MLCKLRETNDYNFDVYVLPLLFFTIITFYMWYRLGRYAVESYLEQILSHGFFHADPVSFYHHFQFLGLSKIHWLSKLFFWVCENARWRGHELLFMFALKTLAYVIPCHRFKEMLCLSLKPCFMKNSRELYTRPLEHKLFIVYA